MILSSIKSRLAVLTVAVMAVLFSTLGFSLYKKLEETVTVSIDSHLHSEVQLVAALIEIEDGELHVELSEAAIGDYSVPLSGHYFQIVTASGEIIARSPSLSEVDATLPVATGVAEPTYSTITGPGRIPMRLHSETFTLPGEITVTVQAADSMVESYELLASFRNALLLLLPVAFAAAALAVTAVAALSMRPIKGLSTRMSTITEKNLSERVSEETATELRPLARSFNTLLARLDKYFSTEKRFFQDASHELRTPASVIKTTCEVTLKKKRTIEEYEEALTVIGSASSRLTRLITRILDVARIESASAPVREALDLASLIEDAVRLSRPAATGAGVSLSVRKGGGNGGGSEGAGGTVTVMGDREALLDALTNVIENGVKYNRAGGSVIIDIAESGSDAVVTVTDDGIGISEDEKKRVFERFFRSSEVRGSIDGSGLGLSIVKSVVDSHGGRVDVKSSLGEGTTFTIYLPEK